MEWNDITALILAGYGVLQVVARIWPTKTVKNTENIVGKVVNFLFSATNIKK